MPRLAVFAAILLLLLVATPALAQRDTAIPTGPQQKDDLVTSEGPRTTAEMNATLVQLFGESEPFAEAFEAIQAAVIAEDAEALAPWVAYPFRVSYDDQELVVENEQQFAEYYEDIVTEDVAEAVTSQFYERLFANSDGVMFGDGQLWMTMICEDTSCSQSAVRIIAIQSVLR